MMADSNYVKQRGQLFLWKYTENVRNYPGWNLSADADGCISAVEVCQEILSNRSQYRSLQVTRPSETVLEVPNNLGSRSRCFAPQRLRIERIGQQSIANSFELNESNNSLVLVLDVPTLNSLQAAFRDVLDGRGDYCLDIVGEQIWVWPYQ